ncbi:MAG: lytic transglycosylase domain-containing protein [Alphaproteobacteria bacterium]
MAATPSKKGTLQTVGETLATAGSNVLPSGLEFAKGMYQTVRHPIVTGRNLVDIGAGVAEHGKQLLPREMQAMLGPRMSTAQADAVGEYFKQRYGGAENIRQTFMKDPVGFLADASTVLSGGGMLAARAPGLAGKIARVAETTGRAIDPVALAAKTVGYGARQGGKGVAAVIGGTTTKGGPVIQEAFQAGRSGIGSAQSRAFKKGLTGKATSADVRNPVQQVIKGVFDKRRADYQKGMGAVHNDPAVIPFNEIEDAVKSVENRAYSRGHSGTAAPVLTDVEAAGAWNKVNKAVQEWKALDPAEFHTPGQIDELKQKIGSIRDAEQIGTPAYNAANEVYKTVKAKIVEQAPAYGKIMTDYSNQSDLAKEFTRATGAGEKAAAATAFNKIKRLMDPRNPAEREAANLIRQGGGGETFATVAGETLRPMFPPIKSSAIEGGALLGGATLLHNPLVAALAPLASPRLMGSAAYRAGTVLKNPLEWAELAGKAAERGYGTGAGILGRGQTSPEMDELIQKYAKAPPTKAEPAGEAAPAVSAEPDPEKMTAEQLDAYIARLQAETAPSGVKAAPVAVDDADLENMTPEELDAHIAALQRDLGGKVEHRESRGNVNAVSPKGAKGPMQLMEGTARSPGYGVAPAKDSSPEENRRVGQDYLNAMIDQYNDVPLALMAYNWGPGKVNEWMKNPDPTKVPKETRDYVNALSGKTVFDEG